MWLNSLFSSSCFGGGRFLRMFSIYNHVNCKKKKDFCFFLIFIVLFFSYIVVLDRVSSILLNRCGDIGYLVPELRSIQYFTIKYDINCCFFIYAYYQVDEIPFFSSCSEFLLMNEYDILSKMFLHQLRFFFSLILLMWWITTIDFII